MPSPFPGMDPYLEGSLWTSVHTALAVEIARQLNRRLSTRYVALTTRRFVMDTPDESEIVIGEIDPDVAVARTGVTDESRGVAGTIAAPLRMATLIRTPIPHVTVEIRDVEQRQLVTVIEILSPTNKRRDGYTEYLDKRDRILRSTTHLIEIDLLRKGRRVPMRGKLPSVPYFVFLSRVDQRLLTDIWPIRRDQPLREIFVRLIAGDDDAKLDLQQALTTVYDDNRLSSLINYSKRPDVSLSPKQAAVVPTLAPVGPTHRRTFRVPAGEIYPRARIALKLLLNNRTLKAVGSCWFAFGRPQPGGASNRQGASQAGSCQTANAGSDKSGMGVPLSIETRNKIHACMAHRWNETKKKTVLGISLGRDRGRSRCLVALFHPAGTQADPLQLRDRWEDALRVHDRLTRPSSRGLGDQGLSAARGALPHRGDPGLLANGGPDDPERGGGRVRSARPLRAGFNGPN